VRLTAFVLIVLSIGSLWTLTRFAAPSLGLGLLQRLLHLILYLPTQRLQRLVDLALDLLAGQLERLLHLLTHGLGDLALHLAKDWLDGLTDLLLQGLAEILVGVGRAALTAIVPGRAALTFLPIGLPCSSISFPAFGLLSILPARLGLPVTPASVVVALAIVSPRLTLSRLAARLVLIIRLSRSSCLFDGHHASLLTGDARTIFLRRIRRWVVCP